MTFDNVPWVVTMKKNDHYVSLYLTFIHHNKKLEPRANFQQFPMSEYVKDPASASGWRTISYETEIGVAPDAANLNPDAMDEAAEGGASEIEPDM